jgi:hypothetical protein
MERKLGGKQFGGGSAALLYFERRVRWRSCDKLQDPPHQHSCMSLSWDAFSSEMLTRWKMVRRRPARFLDQESPCRWQRAALIASNALGFDNGPWLMRTGSDWQHPGRRGVIQTRTKVRFPAAHPLKLTYRRSRSTKSCELLNLVSIPWGNGCCWIGPQASSSFLFHPHGGITYG